MRTFSDESIYNDGSDIIRPGLNYATGCIKNRCDHGVQVINMSFIENYHENVPTDHIFCTICTEKLARKIILYKTKATISFITKGSDIAEKKQLNVKGSDIIFVGNKHKMKVYSSVSIVTKKIETYTENIGIRIDPNIFRDLCDLDHLYN